MTSRASHTLPRSGVILLVVLAFVAAFSVAAYSFSHLMVAELGTATAAQQAMQQSLLADSAMLALLHAEANVSMPHSVDSPTAAKMAVVARFKSGDGPWQFGLQDESAKLNLLTLRDSGMRQEKIAQTLQRFPGVTTPLAESIAGWIAGDSNVASDMARGGADGGISSLDALLGLPGVSRALLYGEDQNQNGLLDSNENDGSKQFPEDNADGKLDTGLSAYWSLTAAESTYRASGQPKINLNQSDVAQLYDQLLEFASPAEAQFVVALRVRPPEYTDTSAENAATEEELRDQRLASAQERAAKQLGQGADTQLQDSVGTKATRRGGIDLRSARRQFESLVELAACKVRIQVDGQDTVLSSPFSADPQQLPDWLTEWEERTTLATDAARRGRINWLQARVETLATVPGVTQQLAAEIVRRRPSGGEAAGKISIGWLLSNGLVNSVELREIAPRLTSNGALQRGWLLGQLDHTQTAALQYVEIDLLGPVPRIRRLVDLGVVDRSMRLPTQRAE